MFKPMLDNWLSFKRISKDEYLVEDHLADVSHTVDRKTVLFAKKLDGKTSPYDVDPSLTKDEIDEMLGSLYDMDFLRRRRLLSLSISDIMITLWIPKVTPFMRRIASLVNLLLRLLWFPVLAVSVYVYMNRDCYIGDRYIYLGSVIGTLLGLVLHEFGHLFASLAYGGRVFEVGVMLRYLVPGAYVLSDDTTVKKRMHRVQIFAAGVEMNLLLAGVSLIIASFWEMLSGFFFAMAVLNTLLAFLNMTFAKGLDGMSIMAELLGVEDLAGRAVNTVISRRKKAALRKRGVKGRAALAVCYLISVCQLSFPIMIAANIVEVISWIF